MKQPRIETVTPDPAVIAWPVMKFAIVSNVWIKMMHFRQKGDVMRGHTHLFDHPTILSKGSLEVTIGDEVSVFTGPAIIYIERGKMHTLVALEDDTHASCIHAIRDGEAIEDIVTEDMIPNGANPRTVFEDFGLPPLTQEDIIRNRAK